MKTPRFNLLPHKDRQLAKRFFALQRARTTLLLLTVTLLVSSIALIGGRRMFAQTLLEQETRTAAAEQMALGVRETSLSQEVRALNDTLQPTQTLQNSFQKWSGILPDVTDRVPEGVVLTLLSISPKPHIVTLEGTAATRENLLALQSALEESPLLSNLSTPTTDLLQRENIVFTITATLSLP